MIDQDMTALRDDKINLQKARELSKIYNARLKIFDIKLRAASLIARHSEDKLPELEF